MRRLLAAVVACLLATGPTMAMAQQFTGKRAEVRLGADLNGADLWEAYDYIDGYYRMADERRFHSAEAGFSYGLGLGYDIPLSGRVVAGVEATLDFSTAKTCTSDFYQWEDFCLKAGRDIGLGIRAGAVVAPGTLLFVKAGYASGRIKMTGRDLLWGGTLSEGKSRDGLRIGGGLEAALSRRLYLKAEYSYTDYSNWQDRFEQVEQWLRFRQEARLDFDRHKMLAVVGARF